MCTACTYKIQMRYNCTICIWMDTIYVFNLTIIWNLINLYDRVLRTLNQYTCLLTKLNAAFIQTIRQPFNVRPIEISSVHTTIFLLTVNLNERVMPGTSCYIVFYQLFNFTNYRFINNLFNQSNLKLIKGESKNQP